MPGADVPRGPGGPPSGSAPSSAAHAPTQAVDRAALEGAPTQAIDVPSIATARTEAVPVSSLPVPLAPAPSAVTAVSRVAPPLAAPPGIAAAPAPRSALRVTAVVVAGLVALAAVAAVLLLGRARLFGTHNGGKAHPGLQGAAVDGAFASLTKEQIRERIDTGGHHVLHEGASEGGTTWTVDTAMPGVTGSVTLHRYPDAAQAERALAAARTGGGAAARDGNAVLHVMLPSQTAAAALLAHIAR